MLHIFSVQFVYTTYNEKMYILMFETRKSVHTYIYKAHSLKQEVCNKILHRLIPLSNKPEVASMSLNLNDVQTHLERLAILAQVA